MALLSLVFEDWESDVMAVAFGLLSALVVGWVRNWESGVMAVALELFSTRAGKFNS